MTDPTLADGRPKHLLAGIDGQKTPRRRVISAICVVVVHILLLFIFWLRAPAIVPEPELVPVEALLLLSPADRDTPMLPQKDEKDIPKGNSRPQNTAPLLIPPLPRETITQEQLQQRQDEELLGGLGRALACTAGQYEYLPESARANCKSYLVPWKLDRGDMFVRGLGPTDPNAVDLRLTGAEQGRRMMETYNPCVGVTGPASAACNTLHGATP